ncbi:uncharacterized protein NECHADRAFT_101443 [Fusarium vanettenii 77-13-4]|uniref:Expressed protein n=1 Tax=Fusarium vanettenii (strain ATCC MYA-4622 / CBS 123669 / FGSC 9596 / NRRL 45880 / 77-13-4) TaxID=660122 RepID=C7YZY8_FUSV7|nr:uncharacterized protein NECHADRAFT_101443 [Fusarium vanettenii 77-13-4]EEU42877.1 expressed protein [Fusarium vanettenii 77-13-4]
MTSSKRSRDDYRERAYVAASRRTDRNVKARMESALMASEIHRKRTGKPLHITEDIVMGDAPYEEEQETWPRPQTYPVVPKSNTNMGVGVVSKESLASAVFAKTEEEWRESEINRLFAEAFPNFGKQSKLLVPTIVPTIPKEDKPPREPTSQNAEGVDKQHQHEHLQNVIPPYQPDEQTGDTPSRPREDSLLGETPSLLGSDSATLTSCSPSFIPDLSNLAAMPSEFFDPNMTEGLFANDYSAIGEGFNFKTDDFAHDGDVNEWLQHVCDSGDMLEMAGWDSQPFDGTMDDWWPMLIDDSAQLVTSTL